MFLQRFPTPQALAQAGKALKVSFQAPLSEQLLDVAVLKGKAQIPPHCQQDDLRLKLSPLE
jgi:hypothetical protein